MPSQKVALITGASRGIGRAIAAELASNNYYIIINYNSNENAANETLEMVRNNGSDGEIVQFDVASSESTSEKIDEICSRFTNIDLLVNNAGITCDGLFAMMPIEDWDKVINTSVRGFYNVTKPVLKKMMKSKSGSIISISSVSGLMGNRGQSNYSAAKAAINGASKAISTEAARFNIRVNVVAPGLIETDMIKDAPVDEIKKIIPMRRPGKAEEVAKVVKFLASEDASYITGQIISVNGGMY